MADLLRDDLKLAGVTRAELYERSEVRMPIRAHDLRSTFVTLSLAAGRSETWVSDRTGHRSTQMISRYRRAARTADELEIGELARTASELGLGELVSMVETVPDLPDCGPGGGPEGWAKPPATSERNITIPALFGYARQDSLSGASQRATDRVLAGAMTRKRQHARQDSNLRPMD